MRITIVAVGRLRAGPELTLVQDYLQRCDKSGRQLGFGPCEVKEVEAKKGGQPEEALLLEKAIPAGATFWCLDERGQTLTSPNFSKRIAAARDDGTRDLAFIIGGADGIDPSLRAKADGLLSFGPMVWPHMLARVMLSEQIYRAISIASGSPYHRE